MMFNILAGSMIFIVSPVLFILFHYIYLFFIKRDRLSLVFFLFLSSTIVGFICSKRFLISDMIEYKNIYDQLKQMSLTDVYDFYDKDIIFYIISKILTFISDDASFFFFFWVFAFYLFISYSLFILYKNNFISYSSFISSAFVLFVNIALIDMVPQLLRQFIACSMLILSIALFLDGRGKKTILSLLTMTQVHFSSIIYMVPFLFNIFNKKLPLKFILFVVFISHFISYLPILSIVSDLFNESSSSIIQHIHGSASVNQNDGDVSIKTYILFYLAFIPLGISIYRYNNIKPVPIFNFLFYSYVVFNSFKGNDLLYLRFSFYMYPLFFMALPFLFDLIDAKFRYVVLFVFSIFVYSVTLLNFPNDVWFGNNVDIISVNFFQTLI